MYWFPIAAKKPLVLEITPIFIVPPVGVVEVDGGAEVVDGWTEVDGGAEVDDGGAGVVDEVQPTRTRPLTTMAATKTNRNFFIITPFLTILK
jgi:hypothetical protein